MLDALIRILPRWTPRYSVADVLRMVSKAEDEATGTLTQVLELSSTLILVDIFFLDHEGEKHLHLRYGYTGDLAKDLAVLSTMRARRLGTFHIPQDL